MVFDCLLWCSHHHDPATCHGDHGSAAEKNGREDDEDGDDDENIHNARAWDDWKDGKYVLCCGNWTSLN